MPGRRPRRSRRPACRRPRASASPCARRPLLASARRPCSGRPARAARAGADRRRRARAGPCARRRRRRPAVPSTRWISTRQRSMWPRKRSPSPAPSCAPSIRPGMSAITKLSWSTAHRAELGLERRERVVGDLRPRARDRRQKGRLAGIRQADQAGVGQQLEPQPEPALLARLARRRLARRAVGRRLEVAVAEPAGAALRQDHGLLRRRQVGDARSCRPRPGSGCRRAGRARGRRRSARCAPCRMPWPPRGARKCCL